MEHTITDAEAIRFCHERGATVHFYPSSVSIVLSPAVTAVGKTLVEAARVGMSGEFEIRRCLGCGTPAGLRCRPGCQFPNKVFCKCMGLDCPNLHYDDTLTPRVG